LGAKEIWPGNQWKAKSTKNAKHTYLACPECGKCRWIPLNKTNPRSTLCQSCSSKGRTVPQERHSCRWKGGRFVNKRGYTLVYVPLGDPYYAMGYGKKNRYALEHRIVYAKYLGRCLQTWETVRHVNSELSAQGERDNRIENLRLVTRILAC